MSVHVTNLFGLSAPTVGYVNESSRSKSVETVSLQDQSGITRCASPTNMVAVETSISGKGDASFALIDEDSYELNTLDTQQVYSVKRTESLNAYPDFEVSAKGYEAPNFGFPADNAPEAPVPTSLSDSAVCPVIGLTSVGYSGTTQFEIEKTLEETPERLNTDGTFDHKFFFDPRFNFSVRGTGDLPPILLVGTDGGLESVAELSSGVTIITATEENQRLGEDPSWSASGEHWPNAA